MPTAYTATAHDVVELERALPSALQAALARSSYSPDDVIFGPESYARYFAAYDAAGRAMIYGSFVPLADDAERRASWDAYSLLCDGGPAYFGVEYDVEARKITRISFNGLT